MLQKDQAPPPEGKLNRPEFIIDYIDGERDKVRIVIQDGSYYYTAVGLDDKGVIWDVSKGAYKFKQTSHPTPTQPPATPVGSQGGNN